MPLDPLRRAPSAATLLLSVLLAPALGAQPRVEASIAAGGGQATDAFGTRASAATLTPSLAVTPDPRLRLALSATGTRYAPSGWSAGGVLGTSARLPLGAHAAVALDGAAARTTTSAHALFTSLDAVPSLEASAGVLTVFGGAHAASGASVVVVPGQAGSPTTTGQGRTPGGSLLPAPLRPPTASPAPTASPTPDRELRASRSALGPVYGATIALPVAAAATLTLVAREERLRVEQLTVVDRSVTAALAAGRLSVVGAVGARRAPGDAPTFGSVAATLVVLPGVALQGAAGTYPANVVSGTFGGRFASAGLVLSAARTLGDRPSAAPAPSVGSAAAGRVRVALRAPSARLVEVAGDWSGWRPQPATRAADGTWYVDVRLARGEYRYAFRVDGARWTVPDGATAVDDGFGGRSAILTVR